MIKILGDTHLGRAFLNNVPLHRRGERERMLFEQFVRELDPCGCPLHVHMGDLFDKPVVSHSVILSAADAYINAAEENPEVTFFILRGNHDEGRDRNIVSSFTLFSRLVSVVSNVIIVNSVVSWNNDIVLFGWDPFQSAAEIAAKAEGQAKIAFGHWDVDPRSDPFNLIPIDELKRIGVTTVYTGHVHKQARLEIEGIDVHVVGSMQPLAHGEGDMYLTLTKKQIEELPDIDVLKDKCVRVILQPGETFDLQIDCLQLQVQLSSTNEASEIEIELGDFNLISIRDETLQKFNIPPCISQKLKDKWSTLFT